MFKHRTEDEVKQRSLDRCNNETMQEIEIREEIEYKGKVIGLKKSLDKIISKVENKFKMEIEDFKVVKTELENELISTNRIHEIMNEIEAVDKTINMLENKITNKVKIIKNVIINKMEEKVQDDKTFRGELTRLTKLIFSSHPLLSDEYLNNIMMEMRLETITDASKKLSETKQSKFVRHGPLLIIHK